MEVQSKFIEDTNEQYSIRNDGVVVKNFFITRSKVAKECYRIVATHKGKNNDYYTDVITAEGKVIKRTVKGLVAKYFNLTHNFTCKEGYLKICFKDEDKRNCHISNLYYSNVISSNHNTYTSEQERITKQKQKREMFLISDKQKKNRQETSKRYTKKLVENLNTYYISNLLGIPLSDMTEELYQAGKTRVELRRKIKQITKENGRT